MSKLSLSFAVGDYDRNRAIIDGRVQIDGVDPVVMTLSPEETFFRAMRHESFDVCELSLSSFTLRTARGDNPFVGIPVFLSRAFRHSSIIVRKNGGIQDPTDLKGKRVGTPEWQLTANVWTRAFLQDDFGVRPQDIHWLRGGLEDTGRIEKLELNLASDITIEDIAPDRTLSDMLIRGEIDAYIGPRAPSNLTAEDTTLRCLFDDPPKAAIDYYRRTRIFPIMHLLGLRRCLAETHPWLPVALQKAFTESKRLALEALADTSASKVTLPFVEDWLRNTRADMGTDFWSYGVEENRHVLENFLRHHHEQGVSGRLVKVEELFHASTLESYRI